MDDDLNTPQAIATLFDMAREINRDRETGMAVGEAQDALREMASVLGLSLEERHSSGGAEVDAFVDLLVETRSQLRAERNWKQADAIRDRLEELGVVMEDSSAGTQWRFRGPQ
jgi:cysteinyl-tRNA synthetase